MKAIGLTFKGMEDIAAKEISKIIGKKAETKDSLVMFEAGKEDICRLCYLSQSFIKICAAAGETDAEGFDKIKIAEAIKKCDLSGWLDKEKSFAARCTLLCDVKADHAEIEAFIGEKIIENAEHNLGFTPKVDLDNPDMTFIGIVSEKSFSICIDFSGADLSKRDYRIFCHSSALKAGIAYAILRIANIEQNDTILDPFCGCGTIAIEAAHLLSQRPINFFNKDKFAFLKFIEFDFGKEDSKIKDKIKAKIHSSDNQMRHIRSAEKNAKIAGVNKLIDFSRQDIEWLDTKFKEHSVDKIVSYPPQMSKLVSIKELEKMFNEFFYQAKYILKVDGRILLLSTEGRIDEMLKKSAEIHDFNIVSKMDIFHGKQKEVVIIFEKKSK